MARTGRVSALLQTLLYVSAAVSLLLLPHAAARTPFKYRSYAKMAAYLEELAEQYPEVVRLSIAQETYKLPYPKELVCGEHHEPCKHFVVHLTNHSTLPDATRPEVFISGALHGNERVGPTTTVELITLMAKYATQYARGERGDAQTAHTRQWLHELVNTRSVILTPMTNAYGYAHDTREELGVDPNRDYNYMRAPHECMTTMTSRVVNEIWRDHVFQLAITFHGGMRAVSYEWGSPDHYSKHSVARSEKSPDNTAQFQIANVLAMYAGAFEDGTLYPTGTMNDVVYGVTGGMEDWGYAASWENAFAPTDKASSAKPFTPCAPTTFGGYPQDKTIYNNVTHRAFNMLIETSFNKEPSESALGAFDDLYTADLDYGTLVPGFRAGHVTQNVRLALMMIELVQPYVRWVDAHPSNSANVTAVDAFRLASLFVESDDELTEMGCGGFAAQTQPVASCSSTACRVTRQANSSASVKLQLAWEVLGAFTVDATHVELSTSADFDPKHIVHTSSVQSGLTRRALAFAANAEDVENADTLGTSLFVACLDVLPTYGTQLFARVVTTVDQDWVTQGVGDDAPSPRIPPQSHVVNARTNAAWNAEWNGHRVKASLEWYSSIITVTIENSNATASSATSAPATSTASANSSTGASTTPTSKMTLSPKLAAAIDAGIAKSSWGDDDEIDDVVVSELENSKADAAAVDESEDSESDDESVSVSETFEHTVVTEPLIVTTVPATSAPSSPSSSVTPAVATAKNAALAANAQVATNKPRSSLRSFGLLVIGSGGLVIVATLAFLYKRVFRSKRKHYMNINGDRTQQPSTAVAQSHGDEDEDDV